MDQVTIELENCYGIRKLKHQFDFSKKRAYAIYAPNGSMKSSFAQTFKDVAEGQASRNRIFPSRKSVRIIQDESGAELPQESVLVLPPYDQFLKHTEKTSTLLLNNDLRQEYEQLHADINKSKANFLKAMKEQSGSRKPLDCEIALTFMKSDADEFFYQALERVSSEMKEQGDAPFADVRYDSIFDQKILDALKTKGLKETIQEYIIRYNQLLESSTYFKKGIFEYYNAAQIAKTLATNGFFDAKHTVTLNAKAKIEISSQKQLEDLISKELKEITKDQELKKKFDAVKKQLEKNIPLKGFQRYLCDHEFLLPHLANVELFKEQVWKSYFKANESLYSDLLEQHRRVKTELKEIEEAARKEQTRWEEAIDLFNERFFVPFALEAKNKAAVTLGHDAILDLSYTFHDGTDQAPVEHDELMKSLSHGEKKALYILNIIFEIEVRRQNQQETLFVVDDIADSFDYKNKYAIIQYLQDISDGPVFKQIMLTHNFDFFRTVSSRFVGYSRCLMATKTETGVVELAQSSGIRNPFLNDWKGSFFEDGKKRIASISFTRNLIEHIAGETDTNYTRLTSLLHWKDDSASIKQSELDKIYQDFFGRQGGFPNKDESVVDMIEREANDCLSTNGGVNFEHKIVLSIGIRLRAERFMSNKITDAAFLASIEKNQTPHLLKRFENDFSDEVETIKTLRKVVLMTPENIHLNAFMYEPILDMSDDSLKSLYREVCELK